MAVTTPSPASIGVRGPLSTGSKAPTTASTTPECAATTAATTAADRTPSASASASASTSPSSSPSPFPPSRSDVASSSQAHHRPLRPASSEFLSDRATAALIRRSLCARQLADRGRSSPALIQELLPPLTSRNDVDLQLYALLSIIIREFVQNWYSKITPDETFVAEIVQVIAHCTRALEQRLRNVDLESLLFDELPELLATHIRAYRIATSPTASAPLQTESHQIYHSLWPLPALSPVPRPDDPASAQAQANNESAYRQLLVHGVLAVLLPTEDLENECLTSLVGQLLSELIIGNLVVGKLSQPWLIWELLIMITRLIRKRNNSGDPDTPGKAEMAQDRNNKDSSADTGWRSWSLQKAFWSFVNWVFLMAGIIRLVISIVALSRSLPPRPHPAAIRVADVMNRDIQQKESQSPSHEASISTRRQPAKVPIVEFNAWRCVGDILEIGTRMPWLQGALSMMQWIALQGPGRVAALNGMLDRKHIPT